MAEEHVSTQQLTASVAQQLSDEELAKYVIDGICRAACFHITVNAYCGETSWDMMRMLCERVYEKIKDKCVEVCKEIFGVKS
jgi:hypothetical protein